MTQENPIIVHLDEVPQSGSSLKYDSSHLDLKSYLSDIIGENPFEAELTITPHVDANCYSIAGYVKTELDLVCSRCAFDFKYQVHEKFNEILLIKDEANRIEHYANGGQVTPTELNGPFCTLLKDNTFNLSEFLHEIIALAEPYSVTGKENCDDSCENYQEALHKGWIKTAEEKQEEASSPFDVLKGYKFDS